MYKKFFGLKDCPFSFSPDPRYMYWTKAAKEAHAALTYGIQSRKGFLLLTGEVGTGKTTLLNRLLDLLHDHDIATAFVFNSQFLGVKQLFDFMLADFEIPCESRSKSQVLMQLNQWLLARHSKGKTTVLIVDEAQNLSDELLEEIRLLTNLETSTEKLLQIVLAGQPELEEKLKRPQLRQLQQRIVFRCKTTPLSREETHGYVNERLRIAGAHASPIFSPEALDTVYRHSQGIPRVVNLLCEHSLINSFADGLRPIPANVVDDIAREFHLEQSAVTLSAPVKVAPQVVTGNSDPGQRVEGVMHDIFTFLRPTDQTRSYTSPYRERK